MASETGFKKYTQAVCGYENLSCWAKILNIGRECKTSVLIRLLMGDYWVAKGDFAKAGSCVQEASKLVPINEKEILYQQAFESFILKGQFAEAAKYFAQILEIDPLDMFAMKRAQLMSFICGDVKSLLAVCQSKDTNLLKKLPFYHGMLAFALEENGEFKEAESICEEGLQLFPHDPWIHHCMAHIYYFGGRAEEGMHWLSRWSNHWDNKMVFMRCHLWWHVGLVHLDCEDNKKALALVWSKCWINSGDQANVEVYIGVLGFLWKYELYTNMAQRDLYKEVVSVILKEDKTPGYFLFDLLYLKALLSVGKRDVAQQFFEKMSSPVTKSYATGLMELVNSESKGLDLLEEGLEKAPQFMGSVEQRLIYHEHYVCECIRLGQKERAKKYIKGLLDLRESAIWSRWLNC